MAIAEFSGIIVSHQLSTKPKIERLRTSTTSTSARTLAVSLKTKLKKIMNSISKIISLFILFNLISCSSEKITKELENHFNSEKISELYKIIDFYKTQIGGLPDDKFEIIFKKHLSEFEVNGSSSKIHSLDFDKQTQLYKTLDKEVFNDIWYYSKLFKVKYHKEYITTITQYQSQSNYQNFLGEVGKYNKHILEYKKIIEEFGVDTTTWLEQTILMNPEEFNLADPNIQLIISIHYLTQNDRNNRLEILMNKIEREHQQSIN